MQEIKDVRVEGNEQVCNLLTQTLERAKLGRIDFAAVITTSGPIDSAYEYSGICGREAIVSFSIDNLKTRIMTDFQARQSPPEAKHAPADMWCYNISRCPASFDIIAWLVNAEMERIREGAPAPLKVWFYKGKFEDEAGYDPAKQEWALNEALITDYRKLMFRNIVRPALKLFGAVEIEEARNGRQRENYSFMPTVQHCIRGEKVPRFRADPIEWGDQKQPVVITLRETAHWTHRNSNLPEWFAFADWLTEQGERVIFVRDNAQLPEQLDPTKPETHVSLPERFETYPDASRNLFQRLQLYCSSKHNYFVGNGPATLCWFSNLPWTMLVQPLPATEEAYFPNTPEGFRTFTGLVPGEQFPWSHSWQKVVWLPDTFETLKQSWTDFLAVEPAMKEWQAQQATPAAA